MLWAEVSTVFFSLLPQDGDWISTEVYTARIDFNQSFFTCVQCTLSHRNLSQRAQIRYLNFKNSAFCLISRPLKIVYTFLEKIKQKIEKREGESNILIFLITIDNSTKCTKAFHFHSIVNLLRKQNELRF